MAAAPTGNEPIHSAHLIRRVDGKLLELLSSLTPPEWDLPTVAGSWRVRDVAAHLLDTALRKLSLARDNSFIEAAEIRSNDDLVRLVNRLNAEGVTVYRRLSPPVLISLMELACDQAAAYYESLDPFAPARFGVSWAGEDRSLNWFDTARELTERWHHQQQIRLATKRAGIMTPELYHPVLDCFARGLPHAFRDVGAPERTSILVRITGECGGEWLLVRNRFGWALNRSPTSDVEAAVTIPQEIAWRIFTKGITRGEAMSQCIIYGSASIAEVVFRYVAIVG
jgi:uncharacterized protein (TIGR03083 family)